MRWGVHRALSKYYSNNEKLRKIRSKKKNVVNELRETSLMNKQRKNVRKIYEAHQDKLYDESGRKRVAQREKINKDYWNKLESENPRYSKKAQKKAETKNDWAAVGAGVDINQRLRDIGYTEAKLQGNATDASRALGNDLDNYYMREERKRRRR